MVHPIYNPTYPKTPNRPQFEMKPLQNLLLLSSPSLLSPPSSPFSLLFSSLSSSTCIPMITTTTANGTTTATIVSKPVNLNEEELTKINLLIPRLCYSNHLSEAIRLVDATLSASPPLKSLSLSILIDSLSSQPDMTQPMSFLTRLRHNPNAHPSLLPINTMLINSFIRKGKPKDALKVFNWMSRPGSPCLPDATVFGILVRGFCRKGLVFEALKVLREMVAANFVPGGELGNRVYRSLLREARVKEAMELKEALGSVGVHGVEGVKKVVEFLDLMIANWTT